jgi:hypothetical protein
MKLFVVFQNSMLSTLPYITSWLFGVGFSHIADWLIAKGFLSVLSSYKVFNSLGMKCTLLLSVKLIFLGNRTHFSIIYPHSSIN